MKVVQGYSGLWTVKEPFTVPETVLTCTGTITISAFETTGFAVFSTIYSEAGLPVETYEADKKDGIKIISLTDDSGLTYMVPDKYIDSVPNYKVIPYSRLMIGIDAGVCYSELDIETLKSEVKLIADNHLGLNVTVYDHRVPSDVLIDEGRHKELETARQANIKFSPTTKTELVKANEEIDRLNEKINILEQLVVQLSE